MSGIDFATSTNFQVDASGRFVSRGGPSTNNRYPPEFQIANVACLAVLEFRHSDHSNQLGDADQAKLEGPYDDWSGYRSVNRPGTVPAHFPTAKPLDPNHWQPLTYIDSTGGIVVQTFEAPQWCYVTPFAMAKGDDLRAAIAPGPFRYGSEGYRQQAEELVNISANLTERQKMIAEYWSDGPNTALPPGHWMQFAEIVSARDRHALDDDVKLFFALSNSLLDTSIAAWDAKRAYDSIRPVTAINLLFKGKTIRGWGGPGKGTSEIDGSKWIPYEPVSFPTPPHPDFVSGHSWFSAPPPPRTSWRCGLEAIVSVTPSRSLQTAPKSSLA